VVIEWCGARNGRSLARRVAPILLQTLWMRVTSSAS
jgi:hypothetical protein